MMQGRTIAVGYTAKRARPLRRRARTTRRPVWVRIRTLKPETRLRFRLVPSSVLLVMGLCYCMLQDVTGKVWDK